MHTYRISTDTSQTALSQKDVGFGRCKLNSSVSQQSRLSPHGLLPTNRCQSTNCRLIKDQPLSHLKQLSHSFLGLILGRSQTLCITFPKMNCSLKSDRHQFFPCSWCHLHFIGRTETISVSHDEKNFTFQRP